MQLVDGTKHFRKMRKGLGSKRNELGPDDVGAIVKLYGQTTDDDQTKWFEVEDFFQVDVEPLRNHPEYPALFRQALGTNTITRQTQASNNCAFLRLGQVVGTDKVGDMAKRLGVRSNL